MKSMSYAQIHVLFGQDGLIAALEKVAAAMVPQVIPECVPYQEPPSCSIGAQYSASGDLFSDMVIDGFEEMSQFVRSHQFDDALAIGKILHLDQEDLIHKAFRAGCFGR